MRRQGPPEALGAWGQGVGWGQVGASEGAEKHAVPLNLLLEPVKQNSFILCVGVMVDWEGSLHANGSLRAGDSGKEAFRRSVSQLNCVCCQFPTKILSEHSVTTRWFSSACERT